MYFHNDEKMSSNYVRKSEDSALPLRPRSLFKDFDVRL